MRLRLLRVPTRLYIDSAAPIFSSAAANKADVSIKSRALGKRPNSQRTRICVQTNHQAGGGKGPDPRRLFNAAHTGFPPAGSHCKLLSIKQILRKITIWAITEPCWALLPLQSADPRLPNYCLRPLKLNFSDTFNNNNNLATLKIIIYL